MGLVKRFILQRLILSPFTNHQRNRLQNEYGRVEEAAARQSDFNTQIQTGEKKKIMKNH